MSDRRNRILIVDDSDICREMLRMVLEDCGYDVIELAESTHFARIVNREKPDLVLLDVSMPIFAGDELMAMARDHEIHRCPIVLFSDRSESELQSIMLATGAAGYIKKTSDAGKLAQLVRRYLP